ncbi:MAG: DUF4124 domain-containing protein [Gammaproteobacteria bacterium]
MRLTLLLLGFISTGFAWAGVYKCTDAEGKTTYQKSPCTDKKNAKEINVLTGTHKTITDDSLLKEEEARAVEAKRQEIERQKLEKKIRKEKLLKEAREESRKNLAWIDSHKEEFSPYAIPPYSEKNAPDIVANFESRLPEIERFRRDVARKALADGQCDRVEASELDTKSSLDLLIFRIDCSNGSRLFFSELDVELESPGE